MRRREVIPRTSLRHRTMKPSQTRESVPVSFASVFLICAAIAPVVTAFSPVAPGVTCWGVKAGRLHSVRHTQIILPSAARESSTVSMDALEQEEDPELSAMPWGDFQTWALRDNLRRYVVTIPSLGGSNGNEQDGFETYALWRSMIQDVTELAGYSPTFLMAMHTKELKKMDAEKAKKAESSSDSENAPAEISKAPAYPLTSTPGVLPFLDQFEFTTEGGVSGRAYGLPGIADGAMITTSAVADVESTVKMGYVRTKDGTVAYELGIPAGDFYSLDGTAGVLTEKARKTMLEALARTAGTIAKGEVAAAGAGLAKAVTSGEGDDMMVKLAGSTAILLAGATAMSMLSHHLTVNVFWV